MDSFHFFALPFELRSNIYTHLLTVPYRDKILVPCPRISAVPPRHDRRWRPSYEPSIGPGLAFLRTCQQAYEEGTAILYSCNVFYFDDDCLRPYEKTTFKLHEFNNECSEWRQLGGGCTHQVSLPLTDYTNLHYWLKAIGERNRNLIQRLQLHFSEKTYTSCIGDYPPVKHKDFSGGDLLCGALELLIESHRLRTLEICIHTCSYARPDPRMSIVVPTDFQISEDRGIFDGLLLEGSRLRDTLIRITGIREFKFTMTKERVPNDDFRRRDCSTDQVFTDHKEIGWFHHIEDYKKFEEMFLAGVGGLRSVMEAGYTVNEQPRSTRRFLTPAFDQLGTIELETETVEL